VTEPRRPLPILDARSRVFFEAAVEGRLLIQRCRSCSSYQFYPRAHCTRCFATDPEWVEASGRGTLHTFSIVRRTPNPEFSADCPYVFAIVDLEEGVRLTANLVDVEEPRDSLRYAGDRRVPEALGRRCHASAVHGGCMTLYLDDLSEGQRFVSNGPTVTEGDIMAFIF
jgi:uncharacterized OB-fold protein